MSYQKVVIVGAPRSGTNMLRDVLTSLPGIETWPCDEINYIWRHGNVRYQTDEFPRELARPAVKRYIRRRFDAMAGRSNASVLVEKTCANSLRVPFVDAVVPDAKYIFIVRDGLDVVGSAKERWEASLDIPYMLKKARFIPPSDFPYYATRYLANRLYRVLSGKKRLAFWGPQFERLEELLGKYSLPEACAYQWKACVEAADNAFARMSASRVYRVRYEDFVENPIRQLRDLLSYLAIDAEDGAVATAVSQVSARSVGKGRSSLDPHVREKASAAVEDTLLRFGYEL